MSSYEDLNVYRRSFEAAKKIYEVTRKLPKDELYGITSQIKRAALSILLNIAEGYGKQLNNTTKTLPKAEFRRYLIIAVGSSNEVKVLLEFCMEMEFIEMETCISLKDEYSQIGKMLNGLIKKCEVDSI